jgi:hypothetical protein
MDLDFYLIACIKIDSKWFADLNEKSKAIKLLEENRRISA